MSTGPHDSAHDDADNETYEGYSIDESDQLTTDDTLGDGTGAPDVDDELDRGYSPPERYSAGQGFGNTPYEEATGESLEQRVAQEEPEPDPYLEAATTTENSEGEVGDRRAGRLVAPDEGLSEDTESELIGDDVGIDGAAASAEEAAVHVVPDE
ncbi:DUF5709 domain-containing protein [Nocardioides acrostichi]|uniref:DUF5709 domain-containing protein n=1 Tax=Nocardioides acrostichi TaxID=2784339 RepID=A0A930YCS0_9ACTN|nr:DUF5709 domain-containing protein [Nocardioides acrostichi]MBF4161724.1 hypothetical protein [Nocardioides acrostichi]